MNKKLKGLLGTILIASSAFAVSDTQKTELVLRDHRHQAAAFTTFHELKSATKEKDAVTSKIAETVFYNQTQSSKQLGEVFGANGKNYITVGTAANVAAGTVDVENNYLLHYESVPASNTLVGTIKFDPKQTTFGSRCDAYVNLSKILDGLYFKSSIVFINVKNDLGMTVADETEGATVAESISLVNILNGTSLIKTAATIVNNQQVPLMYAKIKGSQSITGIGDAEPILGWRFLEEKNYYVGINLAAKIPNGKTPTGEYLWEPRIGSNHWGLGGGLEGGVTLWNDEDQTLKLLGEINYRYLFKETEKRTLGIKDVLTADYYNKHILSHYYLLGEEDRAGGLNPAANVLTRDVHVTPGSQVDGFVVLNYNNGGLTFDLGYNLFWKEAEKVTLKTGDWTDEKYAIADTDYSTAGQFAVASHAHPNETAINSTNIDTSVAQTPTILSHTIFGGLGYIFKDWDYPLMLGLGGGYEFGNDRAAADSFTVYGKIGIAF